MLSTQIHITKDQKQPLASSIAVASSGASLSSPRESLDQSPTVSQFFLRDIKAALEENNVQKDPHFQWLFKNLKESDSLPVSLLERETDDFMNEIERGNFGLLENYLQDGRDISPFVFRALLKGYTTPESQIKFISPALLAHLTLLQSGATDLAGEVENKKQVYLYSILTPEGTLTPEAENFLLPYTANYFPFIALDQHKNHLETFAKELHLSEKSFSIVKYNLFYQLLLVKVFLEKWVNYNIKSEDLKTLTDLLQELKLPPLNETKNSEDVSQIGEIELQIIEVLNQPTETQNSNVLVQ